MSSTATAKVAPQEGGLTEHQKEVQEHAHHGWAVAKTAVKVGTFEKMMKHKKKIAAAVTCKITIIVVVVLVIVESKLLSAGLAAAFTSVT